MSKLPSPIWLLLLGSGVFLLVLGPMLTLYVTPRVKVTPINLNVTNVVSGKGNYFDQDSISVKKNQMLTITQRVMGDVAASERSGYAVLDMSSTVDSPKTLRLKDPRKSLEWSVERFVSDRRTNRPVHCCGEKPHHEGEAYLKFPFDVQKRDYRWWDGTLGRTVVLHFDGVKKIQGYEGYRFTGAVKPTKRKTRQVPGALVGRCAQAQILAEEWYRNDNIELIVDQRTGQILRATMAPKVTLRAPGAKHDAVTLLSSDRLQSPPATQRAAVAFASKNSHDLELLEEKAPQGARLLGTVLATVGGWRVWRGRRTRTGRRGGRHFG